MQHFYRNVPGLGHVAVSRHAQARLEAEGITQELFDQVLLHPIRPDVREGLDILWRERDGVRLVILTNPEPDRGAVLVKTAFRVAKPAAATHRGS